MTRDPIALLETTLQHNKLYHALLFEGPDYAHLETQAIRLASALLQTPQPWQHIDCMHLHPTGKMRLIAIDTVRLILKQAHQSSLNPTGKLIVIHHADRLGNISSHPLLKTLEEPPHHTTFFLLSTQPQELPKTLTSRCLSVHLPQSARPPHPLWKTWLQDYQRTIEQTRHAPKAHVILQVYGLIHRFEGILKTLENAQDSENTSHPPKDDTFLSFKEGQRQAIRQQLFEDIQQHTHNSIPPEERLHCLDALQANAHVLSQVNLWLQANFNDLAGLEHFLLQSMREWARH